MELQVRRDLVEIGRGHDLPLFERVGTESRHGDRRVLEAFEAATRGDHAGLERLAVARRGRRLLCHRASATWAAQCDAYYDDAGDPPASAIRFLGKHFSSPAT